MNKKAIAILGAIFILIVGTLGFLVYTKYSGDTADTGQNPQVTPTPTDIANNINPTPTPTPAPEATGLVKLESGQIAFPVLFFDGTGIDFFDRQGNFYQAGLQSNNGVVSLINKKQRDIPARPNITKVLWPSDGQDYIIQYVDSTGKKRFSYYKFETKEYIDLPEQITSLDWTPDAKKIVYVWLQDGKATLSMADPDAKNFVKLADMWETDNEIKMSPDGTQILYFQTNNSGANNFINSVSADGKIFKGLVKNGQNYGVLWSPDGQKFLFTKKDPSNQAYQLWFYNLTSGEIRNLLVYTTIDKVVWDQGSTFIYAAIPSAPSSNETALTIDSFSRLDITNMDKRPYTSDTTNPVDAESLVLSPTGDKLYFTNAQDGALYYLDLTFP